MATVGKIRDVPDLGMPTPGQYKKAFNDKVVALYQFGYNYAEIAAASNLNPATIESIVQLSGQRRGLRFKRSTLPRFAQLKPDQEKVPA